MEELLWYELLLNVYVLFTCFMSCCWCIISYDTPNYFLDFTPLQLHKYFGMNWFTSIVVWLLEFLCIPIVWVLAFTCALFRFIFFY